MNGPEPAPKFTEYQGKSVDEVYDDLKKVPFFMTSRDATDNNDLVNAIEAVKEESTPLERAQSCMELGDDCFKSKNYQKAAVYYCDALKEKVGDNSITERCLANRAAANFQLQNWRSTVEDCRRVYNINPKHEKSYYRELKSLGAMKSYDMIDDCVSRYFANVVDGAMYKETIKELYDSIKLESIKYYEKQKDAAERKAKSLKEKSNLKQSLDIRGYKLRNSGRPPNLENCEIKLSDPMNPNSELLISILFVYPLAFQTDFISSCSDIVPIIEWLKIVLEQCPEWDSANEYKFTDVEAFAMTTDQKPIPINSASTLLEILSQMPVEIVDQIVSLYIVPKSKRQTFLLDFEKLIL